jgi:hypothetical protein
MKPFIRRFYVEKGIKVDDVVTELARVNFRITFVHCLSIIPANLSLSILLKETTIRAQTFYVANAKEFTARNMATGPSSNH